MTKAYLLFYDVDEGSRENWNTFYTPVEAFASEEDRQARMDFLKTITENHWGDPVQYHFHTVDIGVITGAGITVAPDV